MQDFDFENWDFLDPKIVSKFQKISEVSQMLLQQQNSMKKAQFLSFKDKQNVQNNIDKFKSSLAALLSSQKDHLIDYFDKQVDTVSKRINVPQLSRTFQQSLRLQDSSRGSSRPSRTLLTKQRRFSEGDLSKYLKDKNFKEKILTELHTSTTESFHNKTLNTSIMTKRESCNGDCRLTEEGRGSLLDLNDLETKRDLQSTKKLDRSQLNKDGRIRADSIFTQELYNSQTLAESQFLQSKMRDMGEELDMAKREIKVLRRFYHTHKHRVLQKEGIKKRRTQTKNFVDDRKRRGRNIKLRDERVSDENKENMEIENLTQKHELEVQKLKKELARANKNSEIMRKEVKELGLIVIQNEELMDVMLNNKKQIEKDMMLTKELNSMLLDNFSQFKGYVEKTFGGVSQKLSQYVAKEEYYTEIAKENEQLRQKCKGLLMKLKEMAEL